MIGHLVFLKRRVSRHLRMRILRASFAHAAADVRFDPDGTYSFSNIYVGAGSNLGVRPTLIAGVANIHIGRKVMFGPEVLVVAGGHNISARAQFMIDVTDKTGNEDLGVVVCDDCWIGARALLTRGVTIGRGSVIGAGAIVTHCIPPYSVAIGAPARVIHYRYDLESALAHEAALYPPSDRLTRDQLVHLDETPTTWPRRSTAV